MTVPAVCGRVCISRQYGFIDSVKQKVPILRQKVLFVESKALSNARRHLTDCAGERFHFNPLSKRLSLYRRPAPRREHFDCANSRHEKWELHFGSGPPSCPTT